MLNRSRGFTLIEVIVVIAILGVIAAIALPNLSKFTSEGVEETANIEVTTIHTAVSAYAFEHDGFIPEGTDEEIMEALRPFIHHEIKGTYSITQNSGTKVVYITGLTYPGCTWDGGKWVEN